MASVRIGTAFGIPITVGASFLSRTELVTGFQVSTGHSDAEPGRRPTAG